MKYIKEFNEWDPFEEESNGYDIFIQIVNRIKEGELSIKKLTPIYYYINNENNWGDDDESYSIMQYSDHWKIVSSNTDYIQKLNDDDIKKIEGLIDSTNNNI